MRSLVRLSALLLGMALVPSSFAQSGPVKIAGLVELSGTGTTSGTNFNDGVKLAVKEINAAGGILGRQVEYTASDTQSQPQVAKALAIKAVDDGAYVVMVDYRAAGIHEREGRRLLLSTGDSRAAFSG